MYLKRYAQALRPEPDLTVSEWADRYRLLDQASSSEPGKWRTDRTPYLREIMDSLSAQSTDDIVIFHERSADWRDRSRQQLARLCDPSRSGANAICNANS